MNIQTFGGGKRCQAAAQLLSNDTFCSIAEANGISDIKILPIPSTKDGMRVTGTEIPLSSVTEELTKSSYLVAYGIPKELKELLDERKIRYYDGACDEDFLVENAYLTAVGALSYIFDSFDKIPRDMKFGIIGFGRIGSALARILLFLGARLRIFTSKSLTRIELGEVGIDNSEIEVFGIDFSLPSDVDVLINTAPCDLSKFFPNKKTPIGVRVLNLASGNCFPGILGIEELPSLPGRMFPESAGKSYAEFAIRKLDGENT